MAKDARATGLRATAERCAPRLKEMPRPPPWADADGAFLMIRLSKETRSRWYALFDRDPEWCRTAFAEFAAAARGAGLAAQSETAGSVGSSGR